MNKTNKIARDEIFKPLSNMQESISISDLGWWLETKTDDKYTTIERRFIIEAFDVLGSCLSEIEKIKSKFDNDRLISLDTLKRKSYNLK